MVECTVALNDFLVCIFAWVRLAVVIYPTVEGNAYLVALTQPRPNKEECPIVFVASYFTKTELKYGILKAL